MVMIFFVETIQLRCLFEIFFVDFFIKKLRIFHILLLFWLYKSSCEDDPVGVLLCPLHELDAGVVLPVPHGLLKQGLQIQYA